MNLRHAIAALVGAAAIALVPAGAAWAGYPPASPTIQVLTASASCGDTITVTGQNWKPSSVVDFTLGNDNTALGSTNTNGSGEFSKDLVIPANTAPGMNSVVGKGLDENGTAASASSDLTISATKCAGSQPTPPQTGGEVHSTGFQSAPQSEAAAASPSNVGAAVATEVKGAQVTRPSHSRLAFTGAAGVTLLVTVGLALITIGAFGVVAARKRRSVH